jgi:hypothetical protein
LKHIGTTAAGGAVLKEIDHSVTHERLVSLVANAIGCAAMQTLTQCFPLL